MAGIRGVDYIDEYGNRVLTGGKLAAAKNLAKNPNFYREIGARGGRNGNTGGFAANPELARIAGSKAGKISKRGHKFIEIKDGYAYYIAQDTGNVVKYKHDSSNQR